MDRLAHPNRIPGKVVDCDQLFVISFVGRNVLSGEAEQCADFHNWPGNRIGEINKFNFRTETKGVFKARKGVDEEIVRQISEIKSEPQWMTDFRVESLKMFEARPMPESTSANPKITHARI